MARALTALLLGTLGIAFAAIFVRWALPAPPVVTTFYRIGFATAALLLWLGLRGRIHWPGRRAALLAGAAGVCFGADLALWTTALTLTSVANATLLVHTTPIFVGAYALLAGREKISARFAAGCAVALPGVALLLRGNAALAQRESAADSFAAWSAAEIGDGLALAGAVFFSGYILLIRSARQGMSAPMAVALSGLSATATAGFAAVLRGDPFHGFPAQSWAAFAAAALISHLGGALGVVWALGQLRATFASVALLAVPVCAALLGWLLLGEKPGPPQFLGGALVIAGIALASRGEAAGEAQGLKPRSGHQG
ncbi:MAG: DMT family transporter [Deltaproteobacteria bacterium]|nr:DMT family transporter [Deltaproteobacteria bacterium]